MDLYYAHRIDKTVPIEKTMGAVKELVNAGKLNKLTYPNAPVRHFNVPILFIQSRVCKLNLHLSVWVLNL